MESKFNAQRGPSAFVPIIAGFVILIVSIVPFFFDHENSLSEFSWWQLLIGLIPVGIFTFFTYVMVASTFKMFVSYSITSNGIRIHKPPLHTRIFLFNEIEGLELLTEEETRQFLSAVVMEQNKFSESADIVGYFSMIKRESPSFRYFTITPRAKVTTVGPKETITSLNLKSEGSCVIMKLKTGDKFYLTPSKPDKFFEAFNKARV